MLKPAGNKHVANSFTQCKHFTQTQHSHNLQLETHNLKQFQIAQSKQLKKNITDK